MSYAVETKKRKFDRILESLTEHSTPTHSTPSTGNNASSISLVDYAESESAKKRRLAASPFPETSKDQSAVSLVAQYLPSDRRAFLKRLETFRQVVQWRIPSTERINAANWAKRGWICIDTNLVSCGSCKQRLHVEVDTEDHLGEENESGSNDDESSHESSTVYAEIIKKYETMIIDAHSPSCPWRRRGCDTSIQRIEGLLNVASGLASLKDRYDSIIGSEDTVPHVESLLDDDGAYDQSLRSFRFAGLDDMNEDVLKLAACGWQRKDQDVLECRHCFRSLGLWLYRGEDPAMERLDAVESHLDYCPWSSSEAQDTEIVVVQQNGETATLRKKVPGWRLVVQAIAKDNAKKGRSLPSTGDETLKEQNQSELTPEQREKRVKELLRRIKEVKKPFNVKGLLKRKEKLKT